jgi:hypothetical protein
MEKEDNMMLELLRTLKRVCIIGWLVFFLSNVAWIIAWNLPSEDTTITQENADGYNNYIGNNGDIDNGKADNQNHKENETTKKSKTEEQASKR